MAQMPQLPKSAFDQIRSTPLDVASKLWSAGKTVRSYADLPTPPPPMWEQPQPDTHANWCSADGGKAKRLCLAHTKELEALMATTERIPDPEYFVEGQSVNVRARTISDELRDTGTRTVSLDANPETDEHGNSIADIASKRYHMVPLTRPEPITLRRIDWERRTKLSSPIWRIRIDIRKPESPRVAVIGPGLNHEQRLDAAKRYLARITRDLGTIPSVETIQAWNTKVKAARTLRRLMPSAEREWFAMNYSEADEDPTRDLFTLTDLELHDAHRAFDDLTDEELEMRSLGIPITRAERIFFRTRPSSRVAFDLGDPFTTQPPIDVIQEYQDAIVPPEANAGATGLGSHHELANTEWDLGQELEGDLQDLIDLADPLSILVD